MAKFQIPGGTEEKEEGNKPQNRQPLDRDREEEAGTRPLDNCIWYEISSNYWKYSHGVLRSPSRYSVEH